MSVHANTQDQTERNRLQAEIDRAQRRLKEVNHALRSATGPDRKDLLAEKEALEKEIEDLTAAKGSAMSIRQSLTAYIVNADEPSSNDNAKEAKPDPKGLGRAQLGDALFEACRKVLKTTLLGTSFIDRTKAADKRDHFVVDTTMTYMPLNKMLELQKVLSKNAGFKGATFGNGASKKGTIHVIVKW